MITYAQRRAIMILSGQPPIEYTIVPFVGNEPTLKNMDGKRKQIQHVEARNRTMMQDKMMAIHLLSTQARRPQKVRKRMGG